MMISIITATHTTVNMSHIMNYSFIIVIFIIVFLSLKKIIGEGVQDHHQMRMMAKNFNIVTVPLIVVFTTIVIYQIISLL